MEMDDGVVEEVVGSRPGCEEDRFRFMLGIRLAMIFIGLLELGFE